jgi:hypothetical protein
MLHKYEHCIQQTTQETQYVCNSIKTFDFSTLYITIPHMLLKSRIKKMIQRCFLKKNGKQRYQYLVIENFLMTEHPLYIGKAGIKGLGLFSIFFLEKPLKEVCLIKV